ncbi:DUF417 family protein [Mucilaginibacter sabulilitoris]|uniref:DUF417 family protein n=1 Tax=Mucilaginibacter sabulilitoris TaxID=1173583 RepID=A0ABZ0TTP8_9SPHI|nr:DUF417 family protein [Mucilaginibacter sabulilitoris]WPU94820.1 DUF417 family protein [Mucilaginibacter sabulilitoris]
MKPSLKSTTKQVRNNKFTLINKTSLEKVAIWIGQHDIPFFIGSAGMIVMLIWGGLFKMTASGAESITPLVSNSPLISWHFKVFGPYVGSDIIGATEIGAALLILIGYIKPKFGMVGGLIATLMFFITSTMFLSTPGVIAHINGMSYMSLNGLFLFKDIISLSLSLYLVNHFGTH